MGRPAAGVTGMSKIANVFRRRAEAFETLIAQVRDDQWAAPSPCEGWDVRGVVAHVVMKLQKMLTPLGRVPSPAPTVDDDPLGAFRAARNDVEGVLDDPVLAKARTETPVGTLSAEEVIDRIVSQDMVIHGWDLAKATGQDASINLLDVRAIFPIAASMPPEMRETDAFGPGIEVFGPQVPVPTGAAAQDRLLALLGRDPHWTPPHRARGTEVH